MSEKKSMSKMIMLVVIVLAVVATCLMMNHQRSTPKFEKGKITILQAYSKKKAILEVGEEVKINGIENEIFYVIENNEEEIMLITKYNLNNNDFESQDRSCIGYLKSQCYVPFATGDYDEEGYWVTYCNSESSCDLNEIHDSLNEEDKKRAIAVNAAITYAAKLSKETGVNEIIGRLLSKDEAFSLRYHRGTIIYGTYREGDYLNYWLGSTSKKLVDHVFGGDAISSYSYGGEVAGVRPVIIIPKSKIS